MNPLRKIFPKPNIINFVRTYKIKEDLGVNRRKNALNIKEVFEEDEELDFFDFESDLMNVHKSHKEHVEELETEHEREKFLIVRQKYFKKKFPNFLTWNDKEQMKYLYNNDPEEWTVEKLSEGFPVLPDIVKKIVTANWTKKLPKIANHDAMVQKNWEMFKNGEMTDLPKELVEHLKKFTNRSLNFKPFEVPAVKKTVNIKSNAKMGEFSQIIASYEELKNKNQQEIDKKINVNTQNILSMTPMANENHLGTNEKKFHGKMVTLQQLKGNLFEKTNLGNKLSEEEKLIVKDLKDSSENTHYFEQSSKHSQMVELAEEDKIMKDKYGPIQAIPKKSEQEQSHLIYPERITIPKNLLKKGCTYKLNDCFYDIDGTFLYRVPGLL